MMVTMVLGWVATAVVGGLLATLAIEMLWPWRRNDDG